MKTLSELDNQTKQKQYQENHQEPLTISEERPFVKWLCHALVIVREFAKILVLAHLLLGGNIVEGFLLFLVGICVVARHYGVPKFVIIVLSCFKTR